MGESSDEGAVKIAKTQKRAYVPNLGWRRPVFDARNFYGVHTSHRFFKNYPQVIDTGGVEDTFFGFEIQVVFFKQREDVVNGCLMVFHGRARSDNDVIHVDPNG